MDYLKNPKLIGALIALVVAVALIKIVPAVFFDNNEGNRRNKGQYHNKSSDSMSVSPQGGGFFHQKSPGGRRLTPEQRRENEIEFARMRKKIPGNMYIPGKLSEDERKEKEKFLKDIILLSNKVRKNRATPEEKKKYYAMKLKQVGDQIQFMQYTSDRIAEKRKETGKEYLNDNILDRLKGAIDKKKKEIQTYKDELDRLK